jgi:hypothetical protein
MTHILRLYAELLGEYASYLRHHCFIGPYQPVPRVVFKSFFSYPFKKKYYLALKEHALVTSEPESTLVASSSEQTLERNASFKQTRLFRLISYDTTFMRSLPGKSNSSALG